MIILIRPMRVPTAPNRTKTQNETETAHKVLISILPTHKILLTKDKVCTMCNIVHCFGQKAMTKLNIHDQIIYLLCSVGNVIRV